MWKNALRVETDKLRLDGSLAAQRPDRPTLLYDDGCRFCRAIAEMLCRFARRRELGFLPWSSGIAEAWLAGLAPGVLDRSMHLKLPDGRLVSGNAVLAATLAHVRGLKWVAWLDKNVPGASSFLAWQYGVLAGHRESLSRFVPDRPAVIREPRLQ